MLVNGQECRVITVRANLNNIVSFYAPMAWKTNDITGVDYSIRGDFPHSRTQSFTGFVVHQDIKYTVTGTKDINGNIYFYLMPQYAENHYDGTRI
ncbi:MAG: hypothetical protein RLZZ203_1306 [Cyanobacteriota bacterium]